MPGGDQYFDQVQLLLKGDASPIVDSSSFLRNVSAVSTTQYITLDTFAVGTAFGSSLFSNGGYLRGLAISSPDLALGTGDFTIEMWMAPYNKGHNSANACPMVQIGPGLTAGTMRLYAPGNTSNLQFQAYSGGSYTDVTPATSVAPANSTWYHLALTRSGTAVTIWLDGVSVATGTTSVNFTGTTLYIFCDENTGGWSGWIDEFRLTKGVARYTSAFTPPTEPFPAKPLIFTAVVSEPVVFRNEGLGLRQYTDTMSESVALTPLLRFLWGIQWRDASVLTEDWLSRQPAQITDVPRFTDLIDRGVRMADASTDGFGVSESVSRAARPAALATDVLRVLDALGGSGRFGSQALDRVFIAEVLRSARSQLVADQVNLSDVLSLKQGLTVTERLGFLEVWGAAARFGLSSTDRLTIVDALRRFFGGDAVDSLTLGEVLSRSAKFPQALTDTTGIAEALTNKLVLRVTSADTVGIDDVEALKQLFSRALVDEVEIAAAFVTPGGGVTTWAINTVSGAVTEYGGYTFNSFAQAGSKYLGASSTGLYELNGDTDDGDSIVAQIKSGLMQMAGSHFTQFKGAYLGVRGEGEFILRLITGDDEVYDYSFEADSMRTTRVVLGKGLRARYFAFELITEGQDFDLDTIEFVPLTNTRRV